MPANVVGVIIRSAVVGGVLAFIIKLVKHLPRSILVLAGSLRCSPAATVGRPRSMLWRSPSPGSDHSCLSRLRCHRHCQPSADAGGASREAVHLILEQALD